MIFKITLNSAEKGALVLPYEPDGWKDMTATLKRSLDYHGIFYSFMAQFVFTCGSGKEYIDDGILKYGIDWVCNVNISIACDSGSGQVYSPDYSIDYSDDYGSFITGSNAPIFVTFFEGILNLSDYTQTSEDTTCDLIQSDFVQKILNRIDTAISVDSNVTLDGNTVDPIVSTPYNLTLTSKALIFKTEFECYDAQDSIATVYPNDVFVLNFPLLLGLNEILGGQENVLPFIYTSLRSGTPQGIDNLQPIYINTSALPVTFTLDLNMTGILQVRNSLDATVDFSILIQVGGTNFSFIDYPTNPFELDPQLNVPFPAGNIVNINISASYSSIITINPGEKLFIAIRLADIHGDASNPGLFELLHINFSTFQIQFTQISTTESTTSGAYLVHELSTAIAQRITGQQDAFRSNLFGRKNSQPVSYQENGCFSFTAFSNGKKIRNFPSANDMTYSMSDFFKTLNSIFNIGLGIESVNDYSVIRMEGKEYFYSTDVILQLPFCPNIKTSVAKEYYITDIYIGYDTWESEETNGIDEFNTKHEYNNGIKAIAAPVELLSPTIASSYAAEFTRRKQYADFPTLDWKYDNDNFIFCLNRSVDGSGSPNNLTTLEKNENYNIINNIISPETTYNYRISPARNLLRHIKNIAGSILKYPNRLIKFTYGEGNYLAQTEFINDVCPGNFENNLLTEGQDIGVEESGESALWFPEYLDFEYPLTLSQYLLIKSNQFKCIQVSDSDNNFIKGFIIEVDYKPVGGLTTFKLLKANGN